ncbi:hypothetical protein [Pleurocapsa sp. PCC 7319]|nr:hypothetical protein [Pleurocapsa sp. PCC 7319]
MVVEYVNECQDERSPNFSSLLMAQQQEYDTHFLLEQRHMNNYVL